MGVTGYNMLMVGPPGSGKTILARTGAPAATPVSNSAMLNSSAPQAPAPMQMLPLNSMQTLNPMPTGSL